MPSFAPRPVIKNMTGRTARRFFTYLDPAIRADWPDDEIFAPALASDCYDALDGARKDLFFKALRAVADIVGSDQNFETLRERLAAHGSPVEYPKTLAEAYSVAVDALIGHPEAWREAQYFVRADSLQERRWHVFDVVSGSGAPDADPAPSALVELARAVRGTWNHGSFDLGRTVKFSYALRGGRYEYYVAEVDDYPRDSRECVGGRFVSRMVSPVCGIVLVYDREARTLRAGTTVPLVKAPSIAENWARVVKGVELRGRQRQDARPILENAVDPSRPLALDPAGRVLSAKRTFVQAVRFGKSTRKLSCEDGEGDALDGFVEDIVGKGLSLEDYEFKKVKIALVLRSPNGMPKNVTVTVTETDWKPNSKAAWVLALVEELLEQWEVIDAAAA